MRFSLRVIDFWIKSESILKVKISKQFLMIFSTQGSVFTYSFVSHNSWISSCCLLNNPVLNRLNTSHHHLKPAFLGRRYDEIEMVFGTTQTGFSLGNMSITVISSPECIFCLNKLYLEPEYSVNPQKVDRLAIPKMNVNGGSI